MRHLQRRPERHPLLLQVCPLGRAVNKVSSCRPNGHTRLLHIRGPERQIVPQQLHDERRILVAFL